MSYNVLIVDDEPMIRFGLSSAIQWADEGFRLVGEASNGNMAITMIEQEKVDVLITDIKMPLMDGIALTQRAKQMNETIKVIFVSSYSDFEYAREAVKLGVVVDYLLKPTMEPADLLQILRKCKLELDVEKERIVGAPIKLEKELKKWLNGKTVNQDDAPDWLKRGVTVAVWQPSISGNDRSNTLDNLVWMEKACSILLQWITEGVAFITGEQEWVTIIADPIGRHQMEHEHWHKQLNEQSFPCSTGVAPVAYQIEGIANAYSSAKKILEQSFFYGTGVCRFAKISDKQDDLTESDLDIKEHEWIELRDRFSRHNASGERALCHADLELCYRLWKEGRYTKSQVISQAQSLMAIIISSDRLQTTEQLIHQLSDKVQEISRIRTLEEMREYLEHEWNVLSEENLIPLVPEDNGGAHAIQLALTFIQQKFREEITLQEAADYVYMSKNYFSEQFKRRTGLNFIDFIIRLRIQYAKRLLRTTSLKVYEVARQSGFNSTKHFLKIYKREVGITPAEYRNNRN